ncbi:MULTISPECIES: type VI secretion system Vgr family protein [Pseudomonas]|uniref:Type VI secretion system tip protein TssI/VgrG n=1 Tax=Pseudomonas capeferrum TaxID=1495066 RepID=A0ABY7R4B8_9PSED|nr:MULTISPECIES: type VI secretion system Vgr family protein [Pseudomonas]MUT51976.1 type VI secretion system tip protein VgrG [Pseudomonas sp. TDA1]WCH98597.1 type VI secretion system tip protein TssI/VgrG [Pseudomonas capeferrum]
MSNLNDVRFTFSTPADEASAFDVVSFELKEGISELYRLEIELVSFADDADFATLLDQPAVLTIWQQDEAVRHVHGLISSFEQGKTGHRRTRYRAVIEPQLARAGLQSDWRIFQHRPIPQLLEELFRERQWGTLTQYMVNPHQSREFCVQAGDLDLDFFWRLSAEEGLISIFEHSEAGHGVVQADRVNQFGSLEGEPVLYVPNRGGAEQQPCLRHFAYREQVRSSRQVQRDYTFTHPRYNHEHTMFPRELGSQSSDYERYDYPGRYKHDNAGKPFTQTKIDALFSDARVAEVEGDDARLQPGIAFRLSGHAREDMNILWRPLHITHTGRQFTALEEDAADAEVGTSYSLTASLIPAQVEWHAPALPKPVIEGPQMAKVVGPPGEEIYCDEHGRVRVQFPWDRFGQDDDKSSCWVRVTQAWAGATWGHMAIPRIGQEVVVSFLNGDPDQPMITGRSYHIVNRPPYRLPEFKAVSPIRSKEHHGKRHNELRLDDTTGQISAALMSDHDHSALNLGYLTHPRHFGGKPRGQGFELRTDTHGVVRAGGGLLLTTEARARASEHHTDLAETAERLKTAQEYHTTFANEARDHLAQEGGDQDEVGDALKAQHSAIRGSGGNPEANRFPELADPQLVLASPAGIATSTPESTHIASGEHLGLSTGGHTSMAIGKRLLISASRGVRQFVQSMGWRLVAASGDIDLRALKDNINLLAKLKVSVTAERITLSAKEQLVIQAGGSSTTYNASGIVHATAGQYTAHATDFIYKGSKSQAAAFPEDLKAGKGNLELFQHYANNHPFKGAEYEVEDALGQIFKGTLDDNGKASVANVAPGPVKVRFSDDDVDVWHDPGFPGPHEQITGELTTSSSSELSAQTAAILKQLTSAKSAEGLKSTSLRLGADLTADTAKSILKSAGVPETLIKLSEKAR